MTCEPGGGCWCADLPQLLPVPDDNTVGCLCSGCLNKRLHLSQIVPATCRLERYFPVRTDSVGTVQLMNPAEDQSVPPLDLLKLSTFLRKRGYRSLLQSRAQHATLPQPFAVVLTTVFSWEIPALRESIAHIHSCWPGAKVILMGVLPRKLGDSAQREFGVSVLDAGSETLLDEQRPDYSLVPEWDASILITSRGVCPRECSHCETAARGKGVAKLITNWRTQLDLNLPRIEVWDNTLMLTPRTHFSDVAKELRELDKQADLVCGISPGGVEEEELRWRINQLSGVPVMPARLECNLMEDLPRFERLLAHARRVFGDKSCLRSFAIVNGTENPSRAGERIRRMKAEGVEVDAVCFTPHDWEGPGRYVNSGTGWTAADVAWFVRNAQSQAASGFSDACV
jgi:hypothetical protein